MINRVLIRMKTVQLLYSYLLVEKTFSLESQPSSPTKEKRFAYSLYLDMLYLMCRLSHEVKGKYKSFPLATTRFILNVESDDKIRSLYAKYDTERFPFSMVIPQLAEKIKDSLLFREFEKDRESGTTEDQFWEKVYRAIISQDLQLKEVVRSLPDYTIAGEERMNEMMSETFKNFYSSKENIEDALKTLEHSLQKARNLYMRLLALPIELTELRLQQLEANRKKHLADIEDLNPNMKMVNNEAIKLLQQNEDFLEYSESQHLSWKSDDPELLSELLRKILNSDIYINYIEESGSQNIKSDAEFWQEVLVNVILNDEYFLEFLENKSIFWNDDLEIITSFVVKTLKRLENPETALKAVLPMYKDGNNGKDAKFGAELIGYVIRNKDLYRNYIKTALAEDKWETDRLAFMDVVITMTALAEIINYPEIPLQVSINEYIEIAKSYSSAKSGQFIHGLLSTLITNLKAEGIILK